MTLRLGGDGAITGCTSLEEPTLSISGLTMTTPIEAVSGTAAAPAYTFSGDTDNGLYYAGSNRIGLSTAGNNAILINSIRNVGIGTENPDTLLHLAALFSPTIRIEDTSTSVAVGEVMGAIQFEGNDASTAANGVRAKIEAEYRGVGAQTNLRFYVSKENELTSYEALDLGSTVINFSTNNLQRMQIDSSGRVGIGNTNPGTILDIAGSNPTLRVRTTTANTEVSTLRVTEDNNFVGAYLKYDGSTNLTHIGTHSAADIDVANDNNAITIVRDTRNVGIGTTSPSTTLTVNSGTTDSVALFESSDTTARIILRDNGSTSGGYVGVATEDMFFHTNGTERLRIDSSGRLLVGTTSAAFSSALKLQGSSGDIECIVRLCRDNASPNDQQFLSNLLFSDSSELPSANIITRRDGGTWSSSSKPGALCFGTTPNGSSSPTERMRIDSSGNVGIGTTSPNMGLELFQNSIRLSRTSAVTAHSDISLTHASSADYGSLYFDNSLSTGSFVFRTGGTNEKVRILGAGGITFNGDSAQANALDDYEEGTWTPGLTFGGNSAGIAFSENTGFYNKIGNMVNVWGVMTMTTKGSLTGQALLTNLPFSVRNNSSERGAGLFTYLDNFNNLNSLVRLYTVSNTSVIYLYQADNTPGSIDGTLDLTHAEFKGNSVWRFWFTYRTN